MPSLIWEGLRFRHIFKHLPHLSIANNNGLFFFDISTLNFKVLYKINKPLKLNIMTTEENMEVLGAQKEETQNKENKRQNEKKARPGLKLLLIAGMCVAFLIPQLLLKNLVS